MNLSLKNRVALSFVVANIVVLVLGFSVFFYLDSLNKEIELVTMTSNRVNSLTDEIRISAVAILKYQRQILSRNASPETVERLMNLCDEAGSQLKSLEIVYDDIEAKKIISKMMGYVDSLKLILSKAMVNSRDQSGLASIGDLADKILDAFSEFQELRSAQSVNKDRKVRMIIKDIKRHMMITLVITFLGTILLGLIVPGKIALPFKKIKDAIRELQECNFDVSIYYSKNDEIGELASEMNKMITNLKTFEELRQDRISVEARKFDTLANMIKKPVLVVNAKGELVYMNGHLYSLLQVESDEVISKHINEIFISQSIKDAFALALKRHSKIENAEISIPLKKGDEAMDTETASLAFKGYANVVPIRGKDSSLDYYLMVLSKEIFT